MNTLRLCITICLLTASLAFAAPDKPNVIVILIDDLGSAELGCYGNTVHKTPVMDELARTGVKFETCFTPPVCHPTRFTVMTGQYGAHHGVFNFKGKRGGEGIPGVGPANPDNIAQHITFAQMVKPAGYATGMAGKWQLSGEQPTVVRETGFDEYNIWASGGHLTTEDRQKATAAGIEFHERYWHASLCQNGKWVPTTAMDYGPDIQNDFAIDYIRRHKDQPFFFYYPITLTHSPWEPTPDTIGPNHAIDRMAGKKSPGNLKGCVEYTDKLIGKLVAALDELKIRDKTVVMVTGDNGTGGDGKSQATELGARVPMIVNCPGIVKVRGSTPRLCDTSDIAPTVVDFAGGTLPTDRPIDGVSLKPFLTGASEKTRDWVFAYQADRRIYRTERFLLEDNSPLHYGHLFDCGDKRSGQPYKEVTASTDPDVVKVKALFDSLIARHPAPVLDHEGAPNETMRGNKAEKQAKKAAKKK